MFRLFDSALNIIRIVFTQGREEALLFCSSNVKNVSDFGKRKGRSRSFSSRDLLFWKTIRGPQKSIPILKY